jgi:sialic acid synthase SpsE
MINLYANIGVGHENDWNIISSRVVAAAQCNADAIIMTKTTPKLSIPENKKYVGIQSRWGFLPYIEVAQKSEIDDITVKKFLKLTEKIGIPVIWCVTDTESADWVKEKTLTQDIKIHFDSRDDWSLVEYCFNNFNTIRYNGRDENIQKLYDKYNRTQRTEKLFLYHNGFNFPEQPENLKLSRLDDLKEKFPHANIGYEARSEGLYPDCAVALKKVDYIEKYLGDEEEFNTAILTHQKFYDFFINMNQLEVANGKLLDT